MDHQMRPHNLRPARVLAAATLAAGTLVLGGVGLGAEPQAFAHDAVVGGSPTDGEVLAVFPETITLDFSSYPKEGFNTMAVTNQDGEVLFSGEPTLSGTQLSLAVPSGVHAGDGQYNVGFQITSSDGHATRGKISFTVEGSGGATSGTASEGSSSGSSTVSAEQSSTESSASVVQADAEESSSKIGLWGGVIAAVVVIGAIVVAVSRKKQG